MDITSTNGRTDGETPPGPRFKKTKVGWIPEEWEVRQLRDVVADVSAGRSVGGQDRTIEDGEKGVLRTSAVTSGKFLPEEHKVVASKDHNRLKMSPEEGDILFNRANGTLELVGISVRVEDDYPNLFLSDKLWRIKPDPEVSEEWLHYALRSEHVVGRIQMYAGSRSTGMKNIPQKDFLTIRVATPPPDEQRRIAAILGTWDRATKKIDELIAKKERRKKALIQRLLTGKTRFEGYARQNEFEQQKGMRVPIDWAVHELGDFVSRERSRYESGELPNDSICIELKHIAQETGRLLGHDTFGNQSSSKYAFEEGQVLFGKLRPSLEKFWHAEFDGVCSTEIWVLDADESICLNDYLFYLTQSARFQQASRTTSGTRMPRASWDFLTDTAFMLPPVPEQRKIADLLSTCDEEIEALHAERDALQRQKKGMLQKLIKGKIRVSTEATST